MIKAKLRNCLIARLSTVSRERYAPKAAKRLCLSDPLSSQQRATCFVFPYPFSVAAGKKERCQLPNWWFGLATVAWRSGGGFPSPLYKNQPAQPKSEDGGTGVFECSPAQCNVHSYREALPMGVTAKSHEEARQGHWREPWLPCFPCWFTRQRN